MHDGLLNVKNRNYRALIYYYYRALKVFSCLLLLSGSAYAQKSWELVKSKDNIFIYKRDAKGSALKELKVTSNFESSLSGFIALLKDINAQPSYMYSCMESRVLKSISEKDLIFYQRIKAPWPFINRDGIYHQVIEQDSATHVVTVYSNSMSEYIPAAKDFVRVPLVKSHWTIRPNKDRGIYAEYYFFGDPGGGLPAWLINMFMAEAPYKTQLKMHEVIKQKKYQEAKVDFIVN